MSVVARQSEAISLAVLSSGAPQVAERGGRHLNLITLQRTLRAWLTSEAPDVAAQFGEHARAGLGVYLNNYRAQLLACLSASYPIVRAWIGDVAFEAAAAGHIDTVPPHAWTLDGYGLDFPETLQSSLSRRSGGCRARAPRTRTDRRFVGPNADPVDAAALTDIDWETATSSFRADLHAAARHHQCRRHLVPLSDSETPPSAAHLPEPAHLVIWRHNLAPQVSHGNARRGARPEVRWRGPNLRIRSAEERGPRTRRLIPGPVAIGWLDRPNPLPGR